MKRFLSLLLAFLLLTSCASKEDKTEDTPATEEVESEEEQEEADNTENETEEPKEETEDVEVETDASDSENNEEAEGPMDTDRMIEESDAIAKVKYFHKNGEKHYKILETFRGNFNESFEKPAVDLMENRPYLFFYKEENGKLVPTNGDDSYLLLEGDMHEVFEKIKQ